MVLFLCGLLGRVLHVVGSWSCYRPVAVSSAVESDLEMEKGERKKHFPTARFGFAIF